MSASHDTSEKARTAVAQSDVGTAEAAGGGETTRRRATLGNPSKGTTANHRQFP